MYLRLLQRLPSGKLDEAGGVLCDLLADLLERLPLPSHTMIQRIRRIAVAAAQPASMQPDEDAWHPGAQTLPLHREEDLVDFEVARLYRLDHGLSEKELLFIEAVSG